MLPSVFFPPIHATKWSYSLELLRVKDYMRAEAGSAIGSYQVTRGTLPMILSGVMPNCHVLWVPSVGYEVSHVCGASCHVPQGINGGRPSDLWQPLKAEAFGPVAIEPQTTN